ncbi:SGNH hydrolase-type esterase domain containing protein [Trema orientale]|uniref:SGNH hydrolase-type esterase domain containing protein n=1 Tax=Trema orientale TaxID=63057 RepID=A0A2P5FUK3_TREOI|nr:SGNH hydrolase-type esterase domain containing protein [Trema orientale]
MKRLKEQRELLVLDNNVVRFFFFFLVMGFLSCTGAHGEITPVVLPGMRRNVSAFYVLGDSSVDCGNNTLFYSQLHRNLSLIPCNGSNGNLLPHLLADKMGLPYTLSFYNQNGSVGDLLRGLNFGSAQATIMNPGSQGYQSLNQQLRQVFETIELLQLKLSPDRVIRFIRSSVFYLSFGKDDYINLFLSNSSSGATPRYSSREFAHILVSEMVHVVRSLHDLKIRKIICQGILPLGCTPRMALESFDFAAGEDNGGGCWERINSLVLEYNIMLEEKIIELNAEMPDARVLFCDVYQGIKAIIAKPERYGFEDVKSACCGLGLYGATIGCLSVEMACNNTASHVWWDLYNPTRAVNSLLADSAWSGHPFSGLCRPMDIQDLLT